MTATLAEMTAWSIEEAHAAVEHLLPPGWTYTQSHVGFILGTIHDDQGVVQWSSQSADERFLLLNAYGWLMLRRGGTPPEGPWTPRRQELTSRSVLQHALRIPDPEDLDPEELAVVYSVGPDKGGSDVD